MTPALFFRSLSFWVDAMAQATCEVLDSWAEAEEAEHDGYECIEDEE